MQLLISVASDDEARIALASSRDIILDVKNPVEGSLGAQFPHVLQQNQGQCSPAAQGQRGDW